MPDDALVTSIAADAPIMDEGLGGTEVPYASSERWMLHVEQTDPSQERCSQRSIVAESERAGESPRKALQADLHRVKYGRLRWNPLGF
jgi:hypothetical protein